MATRKTEAKPWQPGQAISFGSSEAAFNAKIEEQINLLVSDRASVFKTAAGRFKGGLPDIIGAALRRACFLENKFIKKLEPVGSQAIAIDGGAYTSGQLAFLKGKQLALPAPQIIGSLIGVMSNPRIIIGVSAKDLFHFTIRFSDIREALCLAKDFPYFYWHDNSDRLEPSMNLAGLLERI